MSGITFFRERARQSGWRIHPLIGIQILSLRRECSQEKNVISTSGETRKHEEEASTKQRTEKLTSIGNLEKGHDGMTKIENSKTQNEQRKSKRTRNKTQEKNQIQYMTRNFKDAGIISHIPNYTCSANQYKGHNRPLSLRHSLWKQKTCEIDMDRDRNLREFNLRAHNNIKIEERTHVQRRSL
jgi:hypothetical protein